MFPVNKTGNEYAEVLGQELYDKTPKAVFAAIAISALTCGGDQMSEARERILAEWLALYQNRIVPQKPPRQ